MSAHGVGARPGPNEPMNSEDDLDRATPDQLRLWRIQYEELHKLMEKSREQFAAWSEEVAMVEGQNKPWTFGDA